VNRPELEIYRVEPDPIARLGEDYLDLDLAVKLGGFRIDIERQAITKRRNAVR